MNIFAESAEDRTYNSKKVMVAIVGGGPGGLFAARHLEAKAGDACEIVVFEASHRVGGKIVTGEIAGIGPYEAGVAEIYDYSRLGPDPLHDLIVKDLALDVNYIAGGPCIIDGKVISSVDDLAKHFGEDARSEVVAFRERCSQLLGPDAFYLSIAEADNAHPWAGISGDALLRREIRDEAARHYVRVMAHSDVAAAPHQTNGLNFLKNVLMDIGGYMDIFSVVGGNEQIVHGLVEDLDATIRVNANVQTIRPLPEGGYRLDVDVNGFPETAFADFVVLAMPLTALSMIHWRSEALQEAIDRHVAYFDRPGHYLRATLAFKRPFWRERLDQHWWMLDAFDGCCVYDESARHEVGGWGLLAFLIAGNAALGLANVPDDRIEEMCLDALIPTFPDARNLLVDRRIHRWMASVNAIPGGAPARLRAQNHRPDPLRLPGIVIVGDYLFDSTLNGVMDSADTATDIILAEVLKRRHSERGNVLAALKPDDWNRTVFRQDILEQFFSAVALADMLGAAFGLKKGARILHFGATSGRLTAALRKLGYDAYGFEFDDPASTSTPAEMRDCNVHGDATHLPFPAQDFEVVIETGLCRLPRDVAQKAIAEVARVARHGMFLGSVTIDLPFDIIERYGLLENVKTLGSRWDWSEMLHAVGLVHALLESARLDEVWKRAVEAGAGAGHWCEDIEEALYCFYKFGDAPASVPILDEAAAETSLIGS
jgi:monoamine oxidase/SAM-dependent methyltransferase